MGYVKNLDANVDDKDAVADPKPLEPDVVGVVISRVEVTVAAAAALLLLAFLENSEQFNRGGGVLYDRQPVKLLVLNERLDLLDDDNGRHEKEHHVVQVPE